MSTPLSRRTRRTYEDVVDLIEDVREQGDRFSQKLHMMEHYPAFPERFWNKNLGRLLRMDPEQLVKVIGYPDPTGERATGLAMVSA